MEMFHRIVMYSNYELLLIQPNSTCLYDSMLVPWDSIETSYNNTTGTADLYSNYNSTQNSLHHFLEKYEKREI